MGTTDNSFWSKIQQGLRETESLLNQKQYNLATIKARQTLEYLVHNLCEKALIIEGDLAGCIDQLYEGRFISKTVKDHYHRIRVLGNKAVHEGNDSPYDAREACSLLAQEVNNYIKTIQKNKQGSPSRRPPVSELKTTSQTSRGASKSRGQRTAPSRQRAPQKPLPHNRSRRRSSKKSGELKGLVKPILIFLVLFLIVLLVVKLIPGKDKKNETAPTTASTQVPTESASVTAPPTEPPVSETEAPKIYTTKSKLNVRSEPSTDSTRFGSLASGTVVDYVKTYDDTWTVIEFEGKQAYVATEFLTVSQKELSSGDAQATNENQ
ncbi:SH3 domain-containing protein [Clostridium sp. E02]|uniref:SH3 domain-containing protein n=1 Tax=Clostridium sp. E02 TaxID=2487134 RepID=UPI000F536E25|nr:SH3 domain-containing protein [Clostridium sp. E02]